MFICDSRVMKGITLSSRCAEREFCSSEFAEYTVVDHVTYELSRPQDQKIKRAKVESCFE